MGRPPWSIVHTEWSDGFGGQEQRILLECRQMLARGHRVGIACRPEWELFPKARAAGVPVTPVPIRSSADVSSVRALVSLFRRERPHVVNTHSGRDSWVASIAAKIAGVPLLIRTRHISVPVRRHALNLVYRWPDGYITTGAVIRDHLVEQGIPGERIVSIPTGVDLARFSAGIDGAAIRREFAIAPDAFLVSMVGVLRSWKRHDLFLHAIRMIRGRGVPVRALVVGEGPRREKIAAAIREMSLTDTVSMTGRREDVPEILAASDAMVLPSDRFEGVPQVILQAMAMARPVVASPVGGIPEVVRHEETGLLCRVGDPASFADSIRRLHADLPLRGRLAEAGSALVRARYSLEAMADRTEEFYATLAARKRLAAS